MNFPFCLIIVLCNIGLLCSLRIGLLMPKEVFNYGIPSYQTSSGAFLAALHDITIPGENVTHTFIDTFCLNSLALAGTANISKGVDVIIGPACGEEAIHVVSLLVSAWGIPIITWTPVGEEYFQSHEITTLISTFGTYQNFTRSLATVLLQYSWKNIGVIYFGNEICEKVSHYISTGFPDNDILIHRVEKLNNFTKPEMDKAIDNVKDQVAIIILCVPGEFLLDVLLVAQEKGMANGDYMFIYCKFNPVISHPAITNDTHKDQLEQMMKSVLHFGPETMIKPTEVNRFGTAANHTIDDFVLYLYDATMMFAKYYNTTRQLNPNATGQDIVNQIKRMSNNYVGELKQLFGLVYYIYVLLTAMVISGRPPVDVVSCVCEVRGACFGRLWYIPVISSCTVEPLPFLYSAIAAEDTKQHTPPVHIILTNNEFLE